MSGVRVVRTVGGPIDASPRVPGSRSITNRALVCAALAPERSTLDGVLWSDDTEAMLGCIEVLGAVHHAEGERIRVDGVGGRPRPGPSSLFTRISGTTSRFILPMCALGSGTYTIDSDPPMRRRPMADGIEALRSLGVDISDDDGHLPIVVEASMLRGGRVSVPGDVSSQFLSGLLLAGPAMSDGLEVKVDGELKSEPYVAMTEAVMASFGASVEREGTRWTVAGSGYTATEHSVEPDASTACYFMAAAAICGGRIRIEGLGSRSIQGDTHFAEVLGHMGCDVTLDPTSVEVARHGRLVGIDVDLSNMSDQAPTFAVVAAFADTPSRATGIGFIRKKESDRVGGTVRDLVGLGIDATELEDGFEIRPGPMHGGRIETDDDHRMAMSFALAGLRTPGVEIADPEVVGKTFVGFWDALEALTSEGDRR